jgi:uncharacterized protein
MLIIYHHKDLDGICSGAVLLKRFPEARLLGYDYGEDFVPKEAFEQGEKVIMADVSMPMEVMEAIAERSKNFTWIDHHVSAHKDFKAYFSDYRLHEDGGFSACELKLKYVYEDKRAACELCWEWAFDEPMPEAVKLLGEYDSWRNQDEERWNNVILPFQYGMRLRGDTPKTLSVWLDSNALVSACTDSGHIILKYQKEQNAYAMKSSFDARLNLPDGQIVRCLVCNRCPPNSMSFESKWDESKYDIMVPIGFDGRRWGMSFYTTKDSVDCSLLAKIFGGGGHRKAAGCSTDDIRKVLIF